jgi:hypothetical protein
VSEKFLLIFGKEQRAKRKERAERRRERKIFGEMRGEREISGTKRRWYRWGQTRKILVF